MNRKGYIYLGLSILAFSTIELVSKFVINDFTPLQMNFLRFFIGGLCLLPFSITEIRRRTLHLSLKDIIVLCGLGILAVPVSMSLFQLSLLSANASVVAVLLSSNALFVAPFSFFILGEKADMGVVMSLILGLLGMAVIAYPSFSAGGSGFVGILCGIASAVTFGLFSVLGKKLTPRLGSLIFNDLVFLSGSIFMLPVLFYTGSPVFSGITFSNLPHILYLGLVVTCAGYVLLFKGLSYLPANRGSLVFFVKPMLAGALAYVFLGDRFSMSLASGTAFIVAGIFITIISSSRNNKKQTVKISG